MIMGVPSGEDFPSFTKELALSVLQLKPIMGWEEDNDCVFDYELTAHQISQIEQACELQLPKDLDLFLTCNAE